MTGEPVAVVLGVALLVLPVSASSRWSPSCASAVRTQQIVRELEEEGELPVDEVPRRASRPVRARGGRRGVPRVRPQAVEDAPDDWRAWFRLGLAYDACGDRRRARQAVRKASRMRSAA